MKVLVYSHSFLPRVGGVELYTDRLARYLRSEGVEVIVVTRAEAPDDYDSDRTYPVARRPNRRQLADIVSVANVVHSNGFHWELMRLTRARGRPTVWFHHDYDLVCPKSIGWNGVTPCSFSLAACLRCLLRDRSPASVLRDLAAFAVRIRSLDLAGVHAVHTLYAKQRMGLDEAIVLPCAADLEQDGAVSASKGAVAPECDRASEAEDPASPPNRTGIIFAGRLVPEKGVDVLLRALSLCRESGIVVGLDLYGDGRERQSLEALVRELGVAEQVRFHGEVDQTVLGSRMRGAVATVVPSVWDEVAGAVALEAMGHGCPVIAAKVGGLGEMVEGIGLLFERCSVKQLASHIAAVATDGELVLRLSEESRRAAHQRYNWSSVIPAYLALYQRMVSSR